MEQGGLGMHGDIILKGTKTKGFKDSLRKTCQRRDLLPTIMVALFAVLLGAAVELPLLQGHSAYP